MKKGKKVSDYLHKSLIFPQHDFDTKEAIFDYVNQKAEEIDFVQDDFLKKIKLREENFPTGIQLHQLGAAIPHTDAECIKNEFISVITVANPVAFQNMEDPSLTVDANIVFVLGLNQPHAQLEMLQSLMGLLQNETVLSELLIAKTEQELMDILIRNNL